MEKEVGNQPIFLKKRYKQNLAKHLQERMGSALAFYPTIQVRIPLKSTIP